MYMPVVHNAATVLHGNRQAELARNGRLAALPGDDGLQVHVASRIRSIHLLVIIHDKNTGQQNILSISRPSIDFFVYVCFVHLGIKSYIRC